MAYLNSREVVWRSDGDSFLCYVSSQMDAATWKQSEKAELAVAETLGHPSPNLTDQDLDHSSATANYHSSVLPPKYRNAKRRKKRKKKIRKGKPKKKIQALFGWTRQPLPNSRVSRSQRREEYKLPRTRMNLWIGLCLAARLC